MCLVQREFELFRQFEQFLGVLLVGSLFGNLAPVFLIRIRHTHRQPGSVPRYSIIATGQRKNIVNFRFLEQEPATGCI
jgi:hypothetical protein